MSTFEEECESVISTTNEEMLYCVQGYTYKKGTKTEIKKYTEFGFDLGDSSEDDDRFSKTPCRQTACISHQAIEDMCGIKTDQFDPNYSVTVDSDDPLVALQNLPYSSQNLLNSLVGLDPSKISSSANNSCKTEVNHTNQQPLSYPNNTDCDEETKHVTSSDIDYPPPSHSTNNNTSTSAVDGNHIITPDNNQCFSPGMYANTIEEKSYVDCNIALNNDDNPTNAKVVEIGNGGLPYNQCVKNAKDGGYTPFDHVLAVQHGGESDDARPVEPE